MTKKNKITTQDNAMRSFWERNEASGGLLLKETSKKYAFSIFRAILLFGMCFLIIQPIINKIAISFMAENDLYDTTIILVPKHFSIYNWSVASYLTEFKVSIWNNIWVSVSVSVIEVFMCSLVGYGFSRFNFPLKRFWFFCVLLIIVIPPQTISTSLYLHFRYFNLFGKVINLRGTPLPYFMMCLGCMGLKNGLYIFMIRQFFMGFPFELEEAAYVDGCGPFKTFFRVMLPGAKPILTSCFLFSFVWQWTDGFYSSLFLGNLKLLATRLTSLVDRLGAYMSVLHGTTVTVSQGFSNAVLSTGVLMTIIPLIILYLFCQRLFVESLTSTGMKE
mgnify:CR=1 FL=1